jgi:2-polyprenyl-3-methyl-5-hydroxy-6-metoxy-1,4-benzoquinol methylase
LTLAPDNAKTYIDLSFVYDAKGERMQAFDCVIQSLQVKETDGAKRLFAYYAKNIRFTQDDNGIRRSMMLRAFNEHWGPAQNLARAAIDIVKLNVDIRECLSRAGNAWPVRLDERALFPGDTFAIVASDSLLRAVLNTALSFDSEMERFLTMTRHAMLAGATDRPVVTDDDSDGLQFYCAIACQCFMNEHVFSYNDDEIQRANELRDLLAIALETNVPVPPIWPVAVAAYFSLHSIPRVKQLLLSDWPLPIAAMLKQQVLELVEEQQLLATIPRLTGIDDDVSTLVRAQYEENPYPRWVEAPPVGKAMSVTDYLHRLFPLVDFEEHDTPGGTDILVAGCGTGYHSILTAQQFDGARVLAVDLSLNSLVCAKHKTRSLGVTSIEYAQADILKLGSIGRDFDVIESIGVLHHLADPWAGWKVLLPLLRPGGFMQLGLYSEVARRNIARIRYLIAERGYGTTDNEIRRCRQDLIDMDKAGNFGNILKSPDFFSTSACRDLLFHVQEHLVTLASIDAFLRSSNLKFLGFDLEYSILDDYRRRFPDDCAATNLEHWQMFEYENPDTFLGMYTFWVQKAA